MNTSYSIIWGHAPIKHSKCTYLFRPSVVHIHPRRRRSFCKYVVMHTVRTALRRAAFLLSNSVSPLKIPGGVRRAHVMMPHLVIAMQRVVVPRLLSSHMRLYGTAHCRLRIDTGVGRLRGRPCVRDQSLPSRLCIIHAAGRNVLQHQIFPRQKTRVLHQTL